MQVPAVYVEPCSPESIRSTSAIQVAISRLRGSRAGLGRCRHPRATLDLCGDGQLELVVGSNYYEGEEITIYRCELKKV